MGGGRGRSGLTGVFLLVFVVTIGVGIASATSEVTTYFGTESGTGGLGGQFNQPRDITVNRSGAGPADPGDIYVVDDNNHRIQRFNKEYDFDWAIGRDVIAASKPGDVGDSFEKCIVAADCKAGSFGTATDGPAGEFDNPQSIAVDQDTGHVYVSDRDNRRIQVFDGDGNFIRMWGFDVIVAPKPNDAGIGFEVCDTTKGNVPADCKSGVGGAGVGQIGANGNAGIMGIAVSQPDGNTSIGTVFFADSQNRRVNTYNLDGSSPASLGTAANFGAGSGLELVQPRKIAVDSRGIVYASDSANGGEIERYDSQNVNGGGVAFLTPIPSPPLLTSTGLATAIATSGLAVDPDSDGLGADEDVLHVLRDPSVGSTVVQQFGPVNDPGIIAAPTAADDEHGKGASFGVVNGLGLDDSRGRLFAAANFGGGHRVYILGFPLVPPTVSIDPVTEFASTTATFRGQVKTDKIAASYQFEYSADGSTWIKTSLVQLPGDSTNHPVSAEVEGLETSTDYQVRLVATKALGGGSATTAPTSFKTLSSAPEILAVSHSAVHDTSVTFQGEIDPHKEVTKYQFEYTSKETFEGEGFLGASRVPKPVGVIADGLKATVEAVATELSAATTYLYRLVAENTTGTTHSPIGEFTTHQSFPKSGECPNDGFRIDKPSERLPDCRAYEQASPMDKNGLDVTGTPPTVLASREGDAVAFAAHSGVSGGEGAQKVPTYLANRGADGWSTQGTLPPQVEGEVGGVIGWTSDFSQTFTEARRFGLPPSSTLLARSSANGALTKIVPHTNLEGGGYFFAGASTDNSKLYFEATGIPLTPDASSDVSNLYVWDRDIKELRLVGILPDSSCGSPPCVPAGGSFAGPYLWIGDNANTGGAQANHYTQDTHAISSDGNRVYFTSGKTGQLYLRENPTDPGASTVHVSASQRTVPDPLGVRPAAFMAATPDGSSVFFASPEKLTDDANTGPEPTTLPAVARADVVDGDPVDMEAILTSARGVTVHGTHIYWTKPKEGLISRAKLNGSGSPSDVELNFIEGIENPVDVAVDTEHVYWASDPTEAVAGEGEKGLIGRAKFNGSGVPTEIELEFIKEITKPQAIAVNDTHIFWGSSAPTESNSSFVGRAKLSATKAEEVQPEFLETVQPQLVTGIAATSTRIYFMGTAQNFSSNSRIGCANSDGTEYEFNCEEIGLFLEKVGGFDVAIDSTFIYWTQTDTNTVGRAKLDGSEPIDNDFISGAGKPKGLAVDATHIYWSANQEALPNPGNDLYRYDIGDKELIDLSLPDSSIPAGLNPSGAEVRGVIGASDDGSHVYFVANGVLTDELNAEGDSASLGTCPLGLTSGNHFCNLYHFHDGEIDFVASLKTATADITDAANWLPVPFSDRFQKPARVSSNGDLLFRSQLQLTDYDNAGKPQFYRYAAEDGSLLCISCNPTGALPRDELPNPIRTSNLTPASPASVLSRTLSDSGDRIFFEATDSLVAADVNSDEGCPTVGSALQSFPACQDVYMWEAEGTGSCESDTQNGGCLYLISTGTSSAPSFFADASKSGDDVFFVTRDRLVGQDGDQLYDMYDARVGGGFVSQNEPLKEECENADECRESNPAPTFNAPSTPEFSAPGDPPPKRKARCPKGQRKVKGKKGRTRCVKRAKRTHRKRHSRTASKTGRASR